jgi:murein DD-endopeptidase MepM/ murein hydrolase activator NlpD
MLETADTPLLPSLALTLGRCTRCGEAVPVRARTLAIEGAAVRVYCSQSCAAPPASVASSPQALRPRSRWWWRLATLPLLAFTSGATHPLAPFAPFTPAQAAVLVKPLVPADPPRYGPTWPPTEKEWLDEIAHDAWIHPLDGPVRRMPIRDARVFGAERPGDRPGECRGGHCGVDLGGEVWGEPIHAAHDGIVERVQRGPNEDHGGLYVSIAHRNGTIFTKYFHLAAIPRWIQPGVHVKMGEVIGLLGDTGVKRSTAHLHFAMSVKPSRELPEQYIDPEPLIALWPLRVPVQGGVMVSAEAAPGVPLGAAGRTHHRKIARAPIAPIAPIADEAPPSD